MVGVGNLCPAASKKVSGAEEHTKTHFEVSEKGKMAHTDEETATFESRNRTRTLTVKKHEN